MADSSSPEAVTLRAAEAKRTTKYFTPLETGAIEEFTKNNYNSVNMPSQTNASAFDELAPEAKAHLLEIGTAVFAASGFEKKKDGLMHIRDVEMKDTPNATPFEELSSSQQEYYQKQVEYSQQIYDIRKQSIIKKKKI